MSKRARDPYDELDGIADLFGEASNPPSDDEYGGVSDLFGEASNPPPSEQQEELNVPQKKKQRLESENNSDGLFESIINLFKGSDSSDESESTEEVVPPATKKRRLIPTSESDSESNYEGIADLYNEDNDDDGDDTLTTNEDEDSDPFVVDDLKDGASSYSQSSLNRIADLLLSEKDKEMESILSKGQNPKTNPLQFLETMSQRHNDLMDALDPGRRTEEAEEDYYAFMSECPVPDWNPNNLSKKDQLKSYTRQMLENPGEFAHNFDIDQKRQKGHIPYFLYDVANSQKLFDGYKPSEIRKTLKENGVDKPSTIKLFKQGEVYDVLPLRFDKTHFEAIPDGQYQELGHIGAGVGGVVAVPVKSAASFERFLQKKTGDDTIDGYLAEFNTKLIKKRPRAVLLSLDKYPQRTHDFITHKGKGSIDGGRDVYLTEEERQNRIQQLKNEKNLSGRALSRAMPYSLSKARRIVESRKRKLPKYLKTRLSSTYLDKLVSELDALQQEMPSLRSQYKPEPKRKKSSSSSSDSEQRIINKALKRIHSGKAKTRKDLQEYDEALELDDTGEVSQALDDAYTQDMIKMGKSMEKEQKQRDKFRKMYKRALRSDLKTWGVSKKEINDAVKEWDDEYASNDALDRKYSSMFLNDYTFDDIQELVADELK